MKTFREYLKEAKKVGTIYHFTKPENLRQMLDPNTTKEHGLPHSLHLISGQNGVISATRNSNLPQDPMHNAVKGDFTAKRGYSVRLALDGDKISNHHKVRPIAGRTDNSPDIHDLKTPNRMPKSHQEREEIVKSDHIDLKKHLKRIDFIYNETNVPSHKMDQEIFDNEFSPKLKEHGIPHSIGRKFHTDHPELNEEVAYTKLTEFLEIV